MLSSDTVSNSEETTHLRIMAITSIGSWPMWHPCNQFDKKSELPQIEVFSTLRRKLFSFTEEKSVAETYILLCILLTDDTITGSESLESTNQIVQVILIVLVVFCHIPKNNQCEMTQRTTRIWNCWPNETTQSFEVINFKWLHRKYSHTVHGALAFLTSWKVET